LAGMSDTEHTPEDAIEYRARFRLFRGHGFAEPAAPRRVRGNGSSP
jgi:hypothetical protein